MDEAKDPTARLDDAIARLERLVAKDPRDHASRRMLGAALMERRSPAQALPHLRAAARLNPRDDLTLYLLGLAAADAGDLDAAIDSWRRLIKERPNHAGGHFALGRAYASKRMWDAALHHLKRVAELDERDARTAGDVQRRAKPAAWEAIGEIHLARNQPGEAVAAWTRALDIDPGNVGVLVNLCAYAISVNSLDEAERYAALAAENGADTVAYHYNLGQIALRRGRPEDAARHFQAAIERDPADLSLRVNRGDALVRAGRVDEAVREWQEVERRDPGHPDANHNLAVEAARAGHVEEALGRWERVKEKVPQFAGAWAAQIELLVVHDRGAEAVEMAERWTRQYPGLAQAWHSLALARLALRHVPKAAQAVRKALDLARDDPHARFIAALLDLAQGRPEEAARRLPSLSPDDLWPGEWAVLVSLADRRAAAAMAEALARPGDSGSGAPGGPAGSPERVLAWREKLEGMR